MNTKILTSSELTYHESSASGKDALDVQFRSTTSPTEYLDFWPVIYGFRFGTAENENNQTLQCKSLAIPSYLPNASKTTEHKVQL